MQIGGGFFCLYNVYPAFTKNLDYFLHLRLTSKCKCAILQIPKASKYKLCLEGVQYETI